MKTQVSIKSLIVSSALIALMLLQIQSIAQDKQKTINVLDQNISIIAENEPLEEVIEKTKGEVLELLRKSIRPEFLNRIDEIIMFTPLSEEEIAQVVRIQLNNITRLLESNGVQIRFDDDVVRFLAAEGFDPQFGARPVKRAINRYLLNELSKAILGGLVDKNHVIEVKTADSGGLEFSNMNG